MNVKEILKILENDGWYIDRITGSHRILKHPHKSGIVVLAGKPSKDLAEGTKKSIFSQAQLEDKR
jgi:predicted RNA binding protein YcfA (HicA-like mRNA interferase family)